MVRSLLSFKRISQPLISGVLHNLRTALSMQLEQRARWFQGWWWLVTSSCCLFHLSPAETAGVAISQAWELLQGHQKTCSIFTSTQSPPWAESRNEQSWYGFDPIYLYRKSGMVWATTPATDSISRRHCWQHGPLPAVHSNNRDVGDYSHWQTVPGSADVQCTGEGSSTVDTGMTAHIGERSAKTHELWSKPRPSVLAPLWPRPWQIRAGGCRAMRAPEGAAVRRKEVGRGWQGKEQEPAPATEKGDTAFPAPTLISDT